MHCQVKLLGHKFAKAATAASILYMLSMATAAIGSSQLMRPSSWTGWQSGDSHPEGETEVIAVLLRRFTHTHTHTHLTALKHQTLKTQTLDPSLEHAVRPFCEEFCQAGAQALHGLLRSARLCTPLLLVRYFC